MIDPDQEQIFGQLEAYIADVLRAENTAGSAIHVAIDRDSGEITATVDAQPIATATLGRIAARVGKQILEAKCRESMDGEEG